MPEQSQISPKRILLVDDDSAARQSIKLLLSIDRHQVTEAASSPEALRLFAPCRFDLALLDYFMPNVQGDRLAAVLRDLDPMLPIVMVSAYAEKLVDSHLPVNAILCKPFGIEELRKAVADVTS
ncbi:MAG TPA: response regulator [Verrucomicrobiae bacterium]